MAAMLPFFGGITAVVGTFGFIPLDFVLPMLLYNMTYKPTKRSFTHVLDKNDDYGCVHSGPARKFRGIQAKKIKNWATTVEILKKKQNGREIETLTN